MKLFIVDDSRLARNELRDLLSVHEQCEVIGEAANVADAVQRIDALQPDLLLLDIQLPDGDGFAVLERLQHMPQVIFTTAFDEYAMRAFEVNALDYLQKPIEQNRLTQALARASERTVNEQGAVAAGKNTVTRKSRDEQIFIRDGERCYFIKLADIMLFEVEGNYTRAYFRDQKPLLPRALSYLDERLDADTFFRASRQHIVNLDFIANVEPDVGDGLLLQLKNGKTVAVSRRQARELRERLEL